MSLVLSAHAAAQQPTPDLIVPTGFALTKFQSSGQVVAATTGGSSALVVGGGSDSCATPDLIAGSGVFPFDNSMATTGPQGQVHPWSFQLNADGVANDVWFLWTATATGTVQFSTCGLTMVDTKVTIWDPLISGGPCPSGTSGVLACIDDLSPSIPQTKLVFNAVAGRSYVIQLGTYAGNAVNPPHVGGTGSFSMDYLPLPDSTPCSADDGEPDAVFRLSSSPNNGTCMLTRHGTLGSTARVFGVEIVWGAAFNAANSTLVNGAAAGIALWEDPNDDGIPDDAVLLEELATTIQNHDTDMLNVVLLSRPYLTSGYYFVGALYRNPSSLPANHHPFAIDWDNLEVSPFYGDLPVLPIQARTFIGQRNNAPFNTTNLATGNGGQPPTPFTGGVSNGSFVIAAYNGVGIIRPICAPEVGQAICTNDSVGLDHTSACPCGNNGSPGNGCANSFNPAGAQLAAYGDIADDSVPSPGATPVVLRAAGVPATSFTMFLQHDSAGDTVFHDGVLCAGGSLVRLRGRSAGTAQSQSPGVALFPNDVFAADSTLTLSLRGGVVGGSGAPRFYSAWYRNASTSFCPPATANVSNGWKIVW